MNDTRTRYTAEYLYPGAFFPEGTFRAVSGPHLDAVLGAAPTDTEGYFRKDGWYAVRVTAIVEKRFVAADGEEAWVKQSSEKVASWVVGERVHYEDPSIAGDEHDILRSNIRVNSKDGYGVKTRAGNWQIASDFDTVIETASLAS